jgi:photosystem II stability/assembly factor-like uncharacterized protein
LGQTLRHLLFALLTLVSVWTTQASGVTVRLRGISAVSDRVAWASGARGTVLRTTDGGAAWTKLAVPEADALDFRDVDAIDERTAYILSIGKGPASRIYKTTDAGATWTRQFMADDPRMFLDAMSFWDARHGLVVGDSIDGEFVILTTGDGGATWTRVPQTALPPALPGEGAFAASGTNIAVVGSSDAWIGTGAGARARVLRTRDGGRTWTVAETPVRAGGSSGIFSIAFRDATHGVVVGGDYSKEGEAIENVAITSDGGATWMRPGGRGLSGFRSVVAYVGKTLIAIGPSGADESTDDGRSWTPMECPGYDTFSIARDAAHGFASGAGGRVARFNGS